MKLGGKFSCRFTRVYHNEIMINRQSNWRGKEGWAGFYLEKIPIGHGKIIDEGQDHGEEAMSIKISGRLLDDKDEIASALKCLSDLWDCRVIRRRRIHRHDKPTDSFRDHQS
jgi:hypothetical protein